MLKFDLIVKLERPLESSLSTEKYLVPALLPTTVGDPRALADGVWKDLKHFKSCYFVFSTVSDFCTNQAITLKQLKEKCFLSKGLMERLICKAVKRSKSNDIANIYRKHQMYSNYAGLHYGRHFFFFFL